MARLTWNATYGFDYRTLDLSRLFDGINTVATSQRYVIDYGLGDRDEFRGHSFSYDFNGIPVGGVVSGYAGYDSGVRILSLDGARISVSSIVNAASTFSTGDDRALIRKALAGHDVITGGALGRPARGLRGER
jgi:serralysin